MLPKPTLPTLRLIPKEHYEIETKNPRRKSSMRKAPKSLEGLINGRQKYLYIDPKTGEIYYSIRQVCYIYKMSEVSIRNRYHGRLVAGTRKRIKTIEGDDWEIIEIKGKSEAYLKSLNINFTCKLVKPYKKKK
jgi:hypothetical protein